MKQETATPVQPIFKIDGKNMVLMTLTPGSGQYKFMDVSDGEIYLFEKYEIPKHYLAELPPLPHSTPVQPTTVGELPDKLETNGVIIYYTKDDDIEQVAQMGNNDPNNQLLVNTYENADQFSDELVRRWNIYPELLTVIKDLVKGDQVEMGKKAMDLRFDIANDLLEKIEAGK